MKQVKERIIALALVLLVSIAQAQDQRLDSLLVLPEFENTIVLRIENQHDVFQGDFRDVRIILEKSPVEITGFDLRIGLDQNLVKFQALFAGPNFKSKNHWYFNSYYEDDTTGTWQYYDFRRRDWHVAGNVFLRTIRFQAFGASTSDTRPTIDPSELPITLAIVRVLVSNNRNLICSRFPIGFTWTSPSDNSIKTNR